MADKRENRRIIAAEYGDQEVVLFFWRKGGDLVTWLTVYDASTHEALQTLKTPINSTADLQKLSHVQSFDVLYFACSGTFPCKLLRKEKEGDGGGYEWSFEDCEIKPPPVLEWNESSEHTIEFSSLPDVDLLATAGDGSTYYPEGSVRVIGSEKIIDELPHFTVTGARITCTDKEGFEDDDNGKQELRLTISNSGYALVVGTYIDISSLGLGVEVYWKCPNDNHRPSGAGGGKSIDQKYTGFKPAEYLTWDRKNGDYKFIVYIKSVKVESDTSLYVCNFNYGGAYMSSSSATIESYTKKTYPTYLGFGTDFWIATKDAPSDISVTNLNYYSPYSGGEADFTISIDGGNDFDTLQAGDYIALKSKNHLSVDGTLDYVTAPEGTEYSLVSPPVEVLTPLESKKDDNGIELRPKTGGGYGYATPFYPVRGEVTFKTQGVWSGILELQELTEEGNLSTIARITSENGNANTELTRDITSFGSAVRVVCVRRERTYKVERSIKGDGGIVNKTLECDEGCQFTLYSNSDNVVYAKVLEKRTLSLGKAVFIVRSYGGAVSEFTTDTYAIGAWGKTRGYPRHVSLFQERLVYGGNNIKPTTLWLSRTNDWGDFESTTEDTSAMFMTMQTEKYDEIKWLKPVKTGITIGTNYGEYIFGDADGGVVTADNARFANASNIGSASITGEVVGTALFMVKTGGQEIHRIDYNTLSEESAGTHVSLLARHLFENSEIVDLFSVKSPTNTTFALCEDGTLATLTYESEYGVTGWGQFTILDGVLDACVFRRDGHDVIAMIVKDTATDENGKESDVYVLGELDLQDKETWLDNGKRYESVLTPTPLVYQNAGSYGFRLNIAGVDVYTTKGTEFYAKLSGGKEVRVERGFDTDNNKLGLERKTTLSATSGWEDEALITLRTDYPGPFVVTAVGVNLRKG